MEKREVQHLSEAFQEYDIVVNCTGLGAAKLVHDRMVWPCRGQVVRVRHNGYMQRYVMIRS